MSDENEALHPQAQKIVYAAASAGIDVNVLEYPDGTRTAQDAATAVGCLVDQIAKSMIFDADGEIVLALTSGAHLVDGAALAELAGVAKCGRADADKVRYHTGYAIGGVPPFAHTNPVRTWIDPHLLTFEEVWGAAGTPRHVFGISPTDLIKLTGAEPAAFTKA